MTTPSERGDLGPRSRVWIAAQKKLGHVVAVHEYRLADNSVSHYKIRRSQGAKCMPFRFVNGDWVASEPTFERGQKPLYRLPQVLCGPDPVWVVEGEKCADALAALGLTATTSGSSSSANGADWKHLRGRAVRIWPDNDAAGMTYANAVARHLLALGCAVDVVDVGPLGLREKQDCVDWLATHPDAQADAILALACHKADPPPERLLAPPAIPYDTGPRVECDGDGNLILRGTTPEFSLGESGLVAWEKHRNEKTRVDIGPPIKILARTCDKNGGNCGVLIEWKNGLGRPHRWSMPLELTEGSGEEYRKTLIRNGYRIRPGQKPRKYLTTLLLEWPADKRMTCHEKIGWSGSAFVLPDRIIGTPEDKERLIFQSTSQHAPTFAQRGTLDGWRAHVASLAAGNSRFVFAISAAFAGPLVELSGQTSGGFNIRGASSSGKSTALGLAASVWGHPREYIRIWRSTTNGLEALADQHNDCLLILDELGQMRPDDIGDAVYMLSNGVSKNRMQKTTEAKPVANWRILFLSSGELSIAEHMATAGRRAQAGQELRIPDIPIDAGAGMGGIESLHHFDTPGDLVSAITSAAMDTHGEPGIAFLEALSQSKPLMRERVRDLVDEFTAHNLPQGADGQIQRVVRRFGLVAAAGHLATFWGITGWSASEAWDAAATCCKAWLRETGGTTTRNREEIRALEQVRAFIEEHGPNRFLPTGLDPDKLIVRGEVAGYRHATPDGFEWWVLKSTFKNEVCKGLDARRVERLLIERGWQAPGNGGRTTKNVSTYFGQQRVHVLTSKVLEDAI